MNLIDHSLLVEMNDMRANRSSTYIFRADDELIFEKAPLISQSRFFKFLSDNGIAIQLIEFGEYTDVEKMSFLKGNHLVNFYICTDDEEESKVNGNRPTIYCLLDVVEILRKEYDIPDQD